MEIKAREIAGEYYRAGYNCAEAMLRTFNDVLNLHLTDQTLKIASGFGGGIGHAGCLCGALAAATMVIGLLEGRANKDESRTPVYTSAAEFHRLFTDRFGAACCRALNEHPFETREHLRNCLKITGGTAELLQQYIAAKHRSQ